METHSSAQGVAHPVVETVSGLNPCPHVGQCGGCQSPSRSYADQLQTKEETLRGLFPELTEGVGRPIVPSPAVFYYRNKMEFAFGGLKDAPPLVGLRQRGKFDRVVDLSECRLLSPEAGIVLAAVRAWATRENIPTYHLKSHRGYLRYLVIREGKNTGQRMIHLVTAPGPLPKESFLEALSSSGVRVDTVIHSVNSTWSDVAYGQESEILSGPGWIEERLGSRTFRISPKTFFQTNTLGAEKLYELISGLVAQGGRPSVLLDFYCGSGSIGLFCADQADTVVGVELNPDAVADAKANAERAGLSHARFVAADASAFVRSAELSALWDSERTVVVMDPPRPGLSSEVLRLLVEKPLSRWIYISCNPQAFARDLPLLKNHYHLESLQPVDLFPHTPHVELVAMFRRK